ncbi:STAS domain-containing protein [Methylocystis sp. IM3]|uniref:STAS domain-containing protein n=1 Tax=Methylocystis sp. IM3 TaxID=3136722 RepID=UPI000FACDF3B|nr:MAG: STAS domain-containing protein [Hyphomicrobiales bacterium]
MPESDTRIVLQLVEGVMIVPFPDPVHDAFFSELRKSVLAYVHLHQISGLVLDLSAVELLDDHDFEMIRRVGVGVKLMGVSVVLAGIRPGAAAGLTMMDLETCWADTALSVESAMERFR